MSFNVRRSSPQEISAAVVTAWAVNVQQACLHRNGLGQLAVPTRAPMPAGVGFSACVAAAPSGQAHDRGLPLQCRKVLLVGSDK